MYRKLHSRMRLSACILQESLQRQKGRTTVGCEHSHPRILMFTPNSTMKRDTVLQITVYFVEIQYSLYTIVS